jgi:predicted kinase
MPTLTITRGLPASGKTVRARAWVAEDPATRARVNRDDLRAGLHGSRLGTGEQERQVTAVQHATVEALLRRGVDVVCDDTNLAQRYARDLRQLAQRCGAEFDVWDLTDVPVEECVARDAARTGSSHVGEDVIRAMWLRFLKGSGYPLPWPAEATVATADGAPVPYAPPVGAPTAVMVDIDGTTAVMCDRSPYDETRVGEDQPNRAVIAAVRAMHAAGHQVIFCSGRTEGCRPATEAWLAEHVAVPHAGLFMRASGDQRKDSIVKRELFDRHIRGDWDVVCVLDDRRQVVDAWREIGLTLFQVAPGDF